MNAFELVALVVELKPRVDAATAARLERAARDLLEALRLEPGCDVEASVAAVLDAKHALERAVRATGMVADLGAAAAGNN